MDRSSHFVSSTADLADYWAEPFRMAESPRKCSCGRKLNRLETTKTRCWACIKKQSDNPEVEESTDRRICKSVGSVASALASDTLTESERAVVEAFVSVAQFELIVMVQPDASRAARAELRLLCACLSDYTGGSKERIAELTGYSTGSIRVTSSHIKTQASSGGRIAEKYHHLRKALDARFP